MPSTHLSLHYHLVFSTKDRVHAIARSWRERLHAYLGGVVTKLGGVPEAIGGTGDHVHLLVGLRATHCLADVIRDLKSNSSRWVHEAITDSTFAWQEGYGAFTVGSPQRQGVCDYIKHQEEHHRMKTFRRNMWSSSNAAGWNTTNGIFGSGCDAPPGLWRFYCGCSGGSRHRLISGRPFGPRCAHELRAHDERP